MNIDTAVHRRIRFKNELPDMLAISNQDMVGIPQLFEGERLSWN